MYSMCSSSWTPRLHHSIPIPIHLGDTLYSTPRETLHESPTLWGGRKRCRNPPTGVSTQNSNRKNWDGTVVLRIVKREVRVTQKTFVGMVENQRGIADAGDWRIWSGVGWLRTVDEIRWLLDLIDILSGLSRVQSTRRETMDTKIGMVTEL